jgi:hypothetical protein
VLTKTAADAFAEAAVEPYPVRIIEDARKIGASF